MDKIRVESYAGTRAEEYPCRIYLNDRIIEIIDVQNRWITPGNRHFRVLGADRRIYVLKYSEADEVWNLVTLDRQ